MSGPPIKRRRRTNAIGPDHPLLAKAFTHKTVTKTNSCGITVTKDILVPLVPAMNPPNNNEATASSSHIPSYDFDAPMEEPGFNDFQVDENMNSRKKSKVR